MKAHMTSTQQPVNTTQPIVGHDFNRKQKRFLMRKLHLTSEEFDRAYRPRISDIKWTHLPDDTIVRLNYDAILSNNKEHGELYMSWVNSHKDMDLHVYSAASNEEAAANLYCIREDTSPNPWLFDLSELEVVTPPDTLQYSIQSKQAAALLDEVSDNN